MIAALFLVGLQVVGPAPESLSPEPGSQDVTGQDPAEQGADPADSVDPGAQESAETTPPPCVPADLMLADALAAHLEDLGERHPEWLRRQPIGRSVGERDLVLLVLTDPRSGSAPTKPGLLVLPRLDDSDPWSEQVLLGATCALAERALADEEVGALLGRVALYVLPVPDPDRRARGLNEPAPPRAAVALDHSFPSQWDPWRVGAAAGPYPLVRPESRALARLLFARTNVAAVAVAGASEAASAPAFRPEEEPPGGSVLAYARADLGSAAYRIDLGPTTGLEAVAAAARLEAALVELLRALPRAVLEKAGVARLGSDLWQVDLVARNVGQLSTAGPRDSRLFALRLGTEGAEILAAAVRGPGDADFEVRQGDPSQLVLGGLDGGQQLGVRLFVRSEAADATVVATLAAERAGQARVNVPLNGE